MFSVFICVFRKSVTLRCNRISSINLLLVNLFFSFFWFVAFFQMLNVITIYLPKNMPMFSVLVHVYPSITQQPILFADVNSVE